MRGVDKERKKERKIVVGIKDSSSEGDSLEAVLMNGMICCQISRRRRICLGCVLELR